MYVVALETTEDALPLGESLGSWVAWPLGSLVTYPVTSYAPSANLRVGTGYGRVSKYVRSRQAR